MILDSMEAPRVHRQAWTNLKVRQIIWNETKIKLNMIFIELDSDDVGDGTLITRDELVEDVHDLKVVKVAQQLRKPHSGLMTPAQVGQRYEQSGSRFFSHAYTNPCLISGFALQVPLFLVNLLDVGSNTNCLNVAGETLQR